MKRVLLAILLAGVAQSARADWPQWRGPNRDGVAADTALPVQWSATQNVRWKVPLPGAGNGSPIVYKDLVLVTATSGRDHGELHVLAYDRGNGQPVWRTNLFASPAPPPYALFPPERGHAAPTPAVDGRQVVALFGSGDLVALDLEGRPLWMRSLVLDYGPIEGNYGLASSPLIVDDLVVVQIDRLDGSYLAAFDVATGATRWKVARQASENWSSPVAATLRETRQVICAGSERLVGYDLKGHELWSVDGLERLCAPTPVVHGQRVYAVSGPAGATLAIDFVSASKPEVAWTSKKDGPFICSPVVAGDLCFVVSDLGIVACRDVRSGEDLWKARLGIDRPRASLVTDGQRVYCTGLDGTTVVFRAAREYVELARNELGEPVAASAALSDGCIFFRSEHNLICIGQ